MKLVLQRQVASWENSLCCQSTTYDGRFLAASVAEVDTVIELAGGGIDGLDFATLSATDPLSGECRCKFGVDDRIFENRTLCESGAELSFRPCKPSRIRSGDVEQHVRVEKPLIQGPMPPSPTLD